MKEIKLVKYTVEQIDQILMLLASVVSDSKAYECSLPMMSVVLDINNLLRSNATVYNELISDNTVSEEYLEADNEMILIGSEDEE